MPEKPLTAPERVPRIPAIGEEHANPSEHPTVEGVRPGAGERALPELI
jgi:hypothetical protein